MAMQEVVPDAPIMDMDQFYKDYTAIGESIYDVMARGIIPVEDHGILRAYRAFAAYEIPFSLEQAADFQEAYVHYLQKISLSQIFRDYFAHTNAELAVFSNGDDTRQRMKFANLQLLITLMRIKYSQVIKLLIRSRIKKPMKKFVDACIPIQRNGFILVIIILMTWKVRNN